VLGSITISVLAKIATWIVLSILGVPYALPLGFVVGFFDLLPLVSATLGAIVVALATVMLDFPAATIAWIAPPSSGRASRITWSSRSSMALAACHPILMIVSVLAGAALLSLLGALLAIPVAAAIQIVLRDWWANRGSAAATSAAPTGTTSMAAVEEATARTG
jgi:predicted PurR-regulated permease PerM